MNGLSEISVKGAAGFVPLRANADCIDDHVADHILVVCEPGSGMDEQRREKEKPWQTRNSDCGLVLR